jgi:hypothetical protein
MNSHPVFADVQIINDLLTPTVRAAGKENMK